MDHNPPLPKSTFSIAPETGPITPGEFFPPKPKGWSIVVVTHKTVSGVSSTEDTVEFPWYWTRLDHPLLDGNPNASLWVMPVGQIETNGPDASIRHNPHPVGVVYRNNTKRWYIYNLGLEAMSVGARFNIMVARQVWE